MVQQLGTGHTNYGEGVQQNGKSGGGHVKFYPYKKGVWKTL